MSGTDPQEPGLQPGPVVADPLLGQTIMGYQVVRLLGAGAMGAVYEGAHRLGGRAAIKLLHEQMHSRARFREQFERETRILFKLDNTHVVKAFGYEALPDGRSCLLMAFHENTPLDRVLVANTGSLPLPVALAYGYQILDGLEAAHQAGVWHRDLKPSNVLELKETTQVDGVSYPLLKIVDFGIAHDSTPQRANTPEPMPAVAAPETRQLRGGTPSYISPEQAGGRPSDARSDLYSFGVMLFEMVSGTLPFVAEPKELLRLHQVEPPPRLHKRVSNVPDELDQLVNQLLEKDPARRPQSATEVKRELWRLLKQFHGERTNLARLPGPPEARPVEAPAPAAPRSSSTDVVERGPSTEVQSGMPRWVIGAAAALAIVASTAGAIAWSRRAPEAEPAASVVELPPPSVPRRAPAPAPMPAPAPAPEPVPAPPAAEAKAAPPPEAAPAPPPRAEEPELAAPAVRPPRPAGPRLPECKADAAWKSARSLDLQDLTKLAAQNGYLDEFEPLERELTPQVLSATPQTCGKLGARIDALTRRYRRPR